MQLSLQSRFKITILISMIITSDLDLLYDLVY